MTESFEVSAVLPASAERLYKAWLSSRETSAFTGGKAVISPRKGGRFSVWDGYIEGRNLELEPHRRIVQSWRTTDFPEGSEDSKIEVTFKKAKGGTSVTIRHTNIPEDQGESYRRGWKDYYFEPMKRYFGKKGK